MRVRVRETRGNISLSIGGAHIGAVRVSLEGATLTKNSADGRGL